MTFNATMCSPVEMRKNLIVVEALKKAGIDFVCIPCKSSDHKSELIAMGNEILTDMCAETEAE